MEGKSAQWKLEIGNGNFAGGNFFIGWWEPEEEWFWQFEPFLKLKTAFCEYWTSIKIKISMTCVSKGYEIKTKMVQEQWLQLKMTFFLGYNLNNFNWWGRIDFWWGGNKNLVGEVYWGEIFPGGGEWTNFQLVEETPLHPPQ